MFQKCIKICTVSTRDINTFTIQNLHAQSSTYIFSFSHVSIIFNIILTTYSKKNLPRKQDRVEGEGKMCVDPLRPRGAEKSGNFSREVSMTFKGGEFLGHRILETPPRL